MEEGSINLVSSEDSTSSSSSEDLPDINKPSCSYKRLSRMHSHSKPTSDSSDSSDESSSSAPTTRAGTARLNSPCQGTKRGNIRRQNLEAVAKRRKLEEEREARQRKNNELNIYKPGQCMKHICVEIHPKLASMWFMEDVTRELEAAGVRFHSTPALVHPGLIIWTRIIPQRLTNVDGQMKLSTLKQHCGMSLYISSAEELAERVADNNLLQYIDSLREMVNGELSIVVFGDFKFSGRKTANSNKKILTELQLEQIKIDLLISTGVDVQFMDKPNELGMWIMQCTKAVAEAPFKNKKREIDYAAAGFYMKGDNRKCVAVDREGHGLGRLWQQMISILPTSSLEVARALCAKYNTPLSLIDSMEQPNGVAELAEIGVTRAGAPESEARRLGPEFARKLHLLYSSKNENIVVE